MSGVHYWFSIGLSLLVIGWILYWGVQSVHRPREVMRGHWWPLADDEPTWPIIVSGAVAVVFALLILGFLLYTVVVRIQTGT